MSVPDFPADLFNSEAAKAVVKLVNGNSIPGSGTFISGKGLLLVNYSSLLNYFSSPANAEGIKIFSDGFSAGSRQEEIPLEGFSLLQLEEQEDVTARLKEGIADTSRNYQFFRIIEQNKQKLISEKQAEYPESQIQVIDKFSGDQYQLLIYKKIEDIRIAYAPAVNIHPDNIQNTNAVYEAASGEFALIRAYDSAGEPYMPEYHFALSGNADVSTDTLTALGFPNETFRLQSSIAFQFFHTDVNPFVLDSYSIYLLKEDSLALSNPEYALRSAGTRFSLHWQTEWFKEAQKILSESDMMELKKQDESDFQRWADADSLRSIKYGNLLWHLDQAFEMSGQAGKIYFAISNFNKYSILDDLAGLFNQYEEFKNNGASTLELGMMREQLLERQQQVLQQIDVDAELFMLTHFLKMFAQIPEDQLPFSLIQLFEGTTPDKHFTAASEFAAEQKQSSFLLNPDKTLQIMKDKAMYLDPLFLLLDDLRFSLEFSQNNYNNSLVYQLPAQLLFARAQLEMDSTGSTQPDANGSMRMNRGSTLKVPAPASEKYFYTTHDFSAKAQGSAIFDKQGILVGIKNDRLPETLFNNYFYLKEHARTEVLSTFYLISTLSSETDMQWLLEELGIEH